jgi:transposase
MRKRGGVSSKSKAAAALEAVKAHEPLGSIARRYRLHPIEIGKWRKRLLKDMHRLFEDGATADAAAHER